MSRQDRLQEQIRTLKKDLDRAHADIRALKSERDRSAVTEFGQIVGPPMRNLHSEIGLVIVEASTLRPQPDGPSSRSAETVPDHEPFQRALRREEKLADRVCLFADILHSERTGAGVELPGACHFCGRHAPRPRRRDSDNGMDTPPPEHTRLILAICAAWPELEKTAIAQHLETELGTSVDGIQLGRWLRWLVMDGQLAATYNVSGVTYRTHHPREATT
jgi:hypothetical protein